MRTLNTLPSGSDGKERVCHAGDPGLIPGLGRSPGRKCLPTPVFLPGESHGQRSLVGYHSWGLRCLPSVSHSTRCSIRSFMCPTVHLTHCTVLLSFSFIKMVNSLELISLPLRHAVGSKRYPSRIDRRVESFFSPQDEDGASPAFFFSRREK